LLTGTTLNVAAQVASLSACEGVELNDFLGGEFGKVKEYAEHIRKTIGDVNGKSGTSALAFCSALRHVCARACVPQLISLRHAPPKMEFKWLPILMTNF
jgi:hypothetical protein